MRISSGATSQIINLTAGLSAKTWSEDAEGYASEAVQLGFSRGKGCCWANDGLDRLTIVSSVDPQEDSNIPKHYLSRQNAE